MCRMGNSTQVRRGLYTHEIRIPSKGGRSPIPNTRSLDPGSYDMLDMFLIFSTNKKKGNLTFQIQRGCGSLPAGCGIYFPQVVFWSFRNLPSTRRIHGTGIFTYIWLIFMVNVGKYTIHGSYGLMPSKVQHFEVLN